MSLGENTIYLENFPFSIDETTVFVGNDGDEAISSLRPLTWRVKSRFSPLVAPTEHGRVFPHILPDTVFAHNLTKVAALRRANRDSRAILPPRGPVFRHFSRERFSEPHDFDSCVI